MNKTKSKFSGLIGIKTKFLPCTNTKGSRIKAIANRNTITIDYDHGLNSNENHSKVAIELCEKMNWNPKNKFYLIGCSIDEGEFMIWTFVKYQTGEKKWN